MAKLTHLGRYRLLRLLGEGGMGKVYEAVQEGLDRHVALKVLPPRYMSNAEFLERFRREAKAAARLNHPNVVTIYDVGEDQGFHFFSMELVEGASLQKRLKEQGPLAFAEAIDLMRQAIGGLGHAWERDIIHRDVKPDNLMLSKAGVLKITDLGLCRVVQDVRITQTGAGMGTPYYMSSEQAFNAKEVDHRSDIYSLGATFYHLLTGRVPFEGSSPIEVGIKVATADFMPVREIRPGTPPPLAAVIEKMLARQPGDRYQSAADLLAALQGLNQSPKEVKIAPAPAPQLIPPPLPALEKPREFTNTIGMKFVRIPPGTFLMGSPPSEKDRSNNETQHRVTLTREFYLGIYPVTQEQWQKLMGTNPSNSKGQDLPVKTVSWDDCQEFLRKLSQKEGHQYCLPTEGEWEYACRAGTTTPFYFGNSLSSTQANFYGNYPYGDAAKGPYLQKTTPVGSYQPNGWGLYDMHGNVLEWCQDCYGEYPTSDVVDPKGAGNGGSRVLRGGSFDFYARDCRAACRGRGRPLNRFFNGGFRVACFAAPRTR